MGYSAGTKMPGQNFQKVIAIFFGALGASFAYTLINGHKNPPKPEDKMDVVETIKDFSKKMWKYLIYKFLRTWDFNLRFILKIGSAKGSCFNWMIFRVLSFLLVNPFY